MQMQISEFRHQNSPVWRVGSLVMNITTPSTSSIYAFSPKPPFMKSVLYFLSNKHSVFHFVVTLHFHQCSLQQYVDWSIFFQACNISEARVLYDQLAVMSPIVMALSAASPIYRGYLCDVDCRWNVISSAVDDRTDEVYKTFMITTHNRITSCK